MVEVKQQAEAETLLIQDVGKEMLDFVKDRPEFSNQEQNHQLLLEAVDLMATYKVDDRGTVREILKLLYNYSKFIDRAILLFECADEGADYSMDVKTKEKRSYILENIAGWVVTPSDFPAAPFNTMGSDYYYIELPFRRACRNTNTHVMAEALYRLTDPELVLDLLRHGTFPSCLYLWPVAVMLDLKFAFNKLTESPIEEVLNNVQICK